MRGTGEGRALTSGGGGDGVGEVLRDVDGVAGPAHLPRMRLSVRIPHVTGAYVDALSLSWPSLTRPLGSAHSPSALARSPRCRQCIEPPRPEPARHVVAASLADTGRRVAARTAPARPRLPSFWARHHTRRCLTRRPTSAPQAAAIRAAVRLADAGRVTARRWGRMRRRGRRKSPPRISAIR